MTLTVVHPTRSGREPGCRARAQVASDDVDLRWALISDKLRLGGYSTHWVGKGHTGYLSTAHLPTSRGFDSFLGFLAGRQSHVAQRGNRNTNLRARVAFFIPSACLHARPTGVRASYSRTVT